MFQVLEDTFSILLNGLNVAEEGAALRGEDMERYLTSRSGIHRRRIKGVEHGDAVGFAEGLKAHFVDQGLGVVSVTNDNFGGSQQSAYPATEANVHL